jgi:hypothetical protein
MREMRCWKGRQLRFFQVPGGCSRAHQGKNRAGSSSATRMAALKRSVQLSLVSGLPCWIGEQKRSANAEEVRREKRWKWFWVESFLTSYIERALIF